MSEWLPVIGLEVHTQLLTQSKMFSACPAVYAGAEPNTYVDAVSLGMPGVLPVVNRQAIEYGIMAALALGCEVPEWTWFERKNYPYPDLPKGFQLTQYQKPIGEHGRLDIGTREVGITRVHLEEDTGKILHVGGVSLIDFNRSGVPLMEIVTEPDCRSSDEAVAYLRKLRDILVFLGIASGRLEEGAMRLEANVSVRTPEEAEQGILRKRCEVKNLNSFESVKLALEYEIARQSRLYEQGEPVIQATLGWDTQRNRTVMQRTKEEADDYRYFPEPDLPPLRLTSEFVDSIQSRLPRLRHEIIDDYQSRLGLDAYRAELLAQSPSFAHYFETAIAVYDNIERVANLLLGDVMANVNEQQLSTERCEDWPLPSDKLAELARQWEAGEITGPQLKQLLAEVFTAGKPVSDLEAIKQHLGIEVLSDLGPVIDQVLAENQDAVEKIRNGEQRVMGFLVGQVMKATRGQADPKQVGELVRSRLED